MEHEGMVHALEEIHRLLGPAGTLIEIHPSLDAPFVEVRSDGVVSFVERDPGFDYEDDLRHAEEAVTSVVAREIFVLEDDRRFELRTHAASVKELRDHFAVAGAYDPEEKDEALAKQQDEMYGRAHLALGAATTASEVIYVDPARMSRLRPLTEWIPTEALHHVQPPVIAYESGLVRPGWAG
jgi:SAM-dependent methyltransferase